jgi:hypothetical protein
MSNLVHCQPVDFDCVRWTAGAELSRVRRGHAVRSAGPVHVQVRVRLSDAVSASQQRPMLRMPGPDPLPVGSSLDCYA